MESILRVVAMYAFLLLVFRLAGKRTLSDATMFDMLMLLVISETTQQAMVDDDHSFTHAFLLIVTFLMMSVGLSLWKARSGAVEKLLDDVPLVILEHGRPLRDRMKKSRVDEQDILEAARAAHGISRLDKIRYAVLERNGEISIIPG